MSGRVALLVLLHTAVTTCFPGDGKTFLVKGSAEMAWSSGDTMCTGSLKLASGYTPEIAAKLTDEKNRSAEFWVKSDENETCSFVSWAEEGHRLTSLLTSREECRTPRRPLCTDKVDDGLTLLLLIGIVCHTIVNVILITVCLAKMHMRKETKAKKDEKDKKCLKAGDNTSILKIADTAVSMEPAAGTAETPDNEPGGGNAAETSDNKEPDTGNATETSVNMALTTANTAETSVNMAPTTANAAEIPGNMEHDTANTTEASVNMEPATGNNAETPVNMKLDAGTGETPANLEPTGNTAEMPVNMESVTGNIAEASVNSELDSGNNAETSVNVEPNIGNPEETAVDADNTEATFVTNDEEPPALSSGDDVFPPPPSPTSPPSTPPPSPPLSALPPPETTDDLI